MSRPLLRTGSMEKAGPPTGRRSQAGERAAGKRSLPELARLQVPENVGGSQTSASPIRALSPHPVPSSLSCPCVGYGCLRQAQPITLLALKRSRVQHVSPALLYAGQALPMTKNQFNFLLCHLKTMVTIPDSLGFRCHVELTGSWPVRTSSE